MDSEIIEEEEIETTEEEPEIEPEQDEPEPEESEPDTEEEVKEPESDEEEVTVSIGDDDQDQDQEKPAPSWVKRVRKHNKILLRENEQLKEKLQQAAPQLTPVNYDPGPKPTLEGCDYDSDQFERKYAEWTEKKLEIENRQKEERTQQEKAQQVWQQRINQYVEKKQKLKVKDFQEAEETVADILNLNQRGMIVQAADSPELVIYALGKNPKRAAELAEINDYVKFAMAIGRLESQLKIKPKKNRSVPEPEKTLKSSASLSATTDKTLDRLRKEAEKTGDYSKVHSYRRQKRKKAG